jgi:glycosyltransferase involved in cell wall biosynthesis
VADRATCDGAELDMNQSDPQPQFSLVVPTYNVERYIDQFLASLVAQTHPLDEIEIVFVDDGSTDSSAERIRAWIATVAPSARLLRKENGGLSSARNAGLDHVTGIWVTFCDPDDTLAPNYFAEVARFLAGRDAGDVDLIACRLLMLDDLTGKLADTHPLRRRFEWRNRVVDLERRPQFVHLSAASGFYRTELIAARHLRFDHRVVPNFEDGHFTGRYLLEVTRPRVAFLRDAAYHYRRRADATSLVQESWHRREKFTAIPRYGYLDLLQRAAGERGAVPVWLQNLVLYDLFWYFKYEERVSSPLASIDDDVARVFHRLLPELVRHIDVATIDDYRVAVASADVRNALVIGVKGERSRPDRLHIERIDTEQRLVEIRYFYGAALPREEFRCRGRTVTPAFAKSRPLDFLRRPMAFQRIVWLPADGPIEVFLDGRRVPIALGRGRRTRNTADPTRRWRRLAAVRPSSPYDDAPRRRSGRSLIDDLYWTVRRWAADGRRRLNRATTMLRGGSRNRRYRRAWVFVDGNGLAHDNAEHLYRYVRARHPEINAWFVIDRESRDWERLAEDGFRLVPRGTPDHRLLMLHCDELISSHVDDDVVDPVGRRRFGAGRWRLTFLQHGVTKDDISRLVNRAPIDRFITATAAEYGAIAADGSPYVFTGRELALTGLPRHDRLLQLGAAASADDARLLLVMPTWRRDLFGDAGAAGGLRALPGFWDSAYATTWLELLRADRLRLLAARAGLRIAFVPHPAMSMMADASVPTDVDVHRYEDVDVQQLFVRGAVIITDYSSNAFELAYLNRPVIYFQFDRERFFSGQHVYRQGAWSYARDGFGPVGESVSAVLDELERLVDSAMVPAEPYATRMAGAFAFRDGRCCERVFESILATRRRPLRSGR